MCAGRFGTLTLSDMQSERGESDLVNGLRARQASGGSYLALVARRRFATHLSNCPIVLPCHIPAPRIWSQYVVLATYCDAEPALPLSH